MSFATKGLSIVLSLYFFALGAVPAQASVGVLVAPARIDLAEKPDDTTVERTLTIANRGNTTNTFRVSAVDVVIVQGVPQVLPANSTPYSAAAVTTLSPVSLTLEPGKAGTVRVAFDVSAHRPLLGGLLVVPGQQANTGSGEGGGGSGVGIATVPQVLVIVSAGPVDASGELLPSVQLGLTAAGLQVPALIESGPITALATLRNSGNVYARIFSTFEFSNLGHAFLRVQAPPNSAMPGLTTSTAATTRQRLEVGGDAVDSAPWLCICQVRVSSVAWLADRQTAPPVVQTAYVLIFPWRVAAIVLVALAIVAAAWRWRRRKR